MQRARLTQKQINLSPNPNSQGNTKHKNHALLLFSSITFPI
uniref:Uncharacterized protein n=1 Tax=Rhizophora mucronata TaxID=61149 RepID=A0A2P2QBP7_RHIMU